MSRLAAVAILIGLCAGAASAQPSLAVSTAVLNPGQPVTITVTGEPADLFAVIGSSVNSGFSYDRLPFGAGPDVAVLATGTLNDAGTATVIITPPFSGTLLDRYYLQAATSPVPSFRPFAASDIEVIRNGDLTAGLEGVTGLPATPALVGLPVAMGSQSATGPPASPRAPGGMNPFAAREPSEGWLSTDLEPVDLPADGSFLMVARAYVRSTSDASTRVVCSIGGAFESVLSANGIAVVPAGHDITITVLGKAATGAAGATPVVSCGSVPNVRLISAAVASVRVGSLRQDR